MLVNNNSYPVLSVMKYLKYLDKTRKNSNTHYDRYAMEISHEYLNRSEIEKVRSIQKENDIKNKMK